MIRVAWAGHLSTSSGLADRERAAALVPAAAIYQRLADKQEESGINPLPALQHAVDLEPENPDRRMRLALRAELHGDFSLAESSLLAAAARSRHYQPRYLLANYYARRRNADLFRRWVHEAFLAAPGDVSPLLESWWQMQPDAGLLSREAVRYQPAIARQFLAFLSRHDTADSVRALAEHLVRGGSTADLPSLLIFCNAALDAGDVRGAVSVWNAACRKRLLPHTTLHPDRGISVANPAFQHSPLENGFDWRILTPSWMTKDLAGGLRLTFSGKQPERSLLAWQYIPVLRGAHYHLTSSISADPGQPAGLVWMVLDGAGSALPAQRAPDGSLTFDAPADLLRLSLWYHRPIGSVRFAGTATIREVRLEMRP